MAPELKPISQEQPLVPVTQWHKSSHEINQREEPQPSLSPPLKATQMPYTPSKAGQQMLLATDGANKARSSLHRMWPWCSQEPGWDRNKPSHPPLHTASAW